MTWSRQSQATARSKFSKALSFRVAAGIEINLAAIGSEVLKRFRAGELDHARLEFGIALELFAEDLRRLAGKIDAAGTIRRRGGLVGHGVFLAAMRRRNPIVDWRKLIFKHDLFQFLDLLQFLNCP